jgi:prolyl-tRNA editing enzyme YbaK/EbsC (Cys-tRNA(Pro) deacylase)
VSEAVPDTAHIEARVREALAATGVPYTEVPCDPGLADTAAFCEHYGFPLEQSANAILVSSKKPPFVYALCLVLAPDRLDVNSTVRKKLGASRCSFAPPEVTQEVTGMMIGGVTPFAVPDTLPIWIDARVMACEWVIVGGGSRALKIQVSPEALAKLPAAEVVAGLSKQPL